MMRRALGEIFDLSRRLGHTIARAAPTSNSSALVSVP